MHVVHLQHRRGRGGDRRRARRRRHQLAPDHQQRQIVLAGLRGRLLGDELAGAQHRHAVGHRHHFVELVADEDDAHAIGDEVAQRGEQRLGLLRRQHRGRLVEDEDARPAVQRLENLDPLLFADRQCADPRVGVDLQAEALREVEQPRARATPIGARPPPRLGADHHVVDHAQVVRQREVLMHHADAGSERGARVARRQRGAADLDAAGVGAVVAEQDRHQCRLAGAVLAEQRQHLALGQRERDRIVGDERTEALGDARQAQHRRSTGVVHAASAARTGASTWHTASSRLPSGSRTKAA
jgi:hypothetical protein